MPGCFTPTEILSAWDAGADVIKVFPATVVGPGYFKDVRAPLPQVKLMPTGGVTVENAGDWIRAGAVAVGVGSALLDAKAIASDTMTPIVEAAKRIVANVRGASEHVMAARVVTFGEIMLRLSPRGSSDSFRRPCSPPRSAAVKPMSPSASRISAVRACLRARLPAHAIGMRWARRRAQTSSFAAATVSGSTSPRPARASAHRR